MSGAAERPLRAGVKLGSGSNVARNVVHSGAFRLALGLFVESRSL